MEAIKRNVYVLDLIKNQTETVCLEAVKQDGCALKYIKEQTEEMCLEAIKQNCFTLVHVNRTIAWKLFKNKIYRIFNLEENQYEIISQNSEIELTNKKQN